MNSSLKWKLIAGFVLVFLAGGATGVFMSAATAHHFIGAHRHGFAAQAMKSRLQWQLRLTEEQMAKISPIIEKTGAKLEEIRGDTGRRVRETIAEAHREIAPLLTPEQQQRLKQMEEQHRRSFQNHGPG
jgi:Spy/CpxP family protein refolding chaperone